MLTKHGVYLLEYNMRFGNPETQAILPLLESDLLTIIEATVAKKLVDFQLNWRLGASCCIVLAAKGYPQQPETGIPLRGLTEFVHQDCYLFMDGVATDAQQLVTSGGRVLNVVAIGHTLDEARHKAYTALKTVNFVGNYYRNDIGRVIAEKYHYQD